MGEAVSGTVGRYSRRPIISWILTADVYGKKLTLIANHYKTDSKVSILGRRHKYQWEIIGRTLSKHAVC